MKCDRKRVLQHANKRKMSKRKTKIKIGIPHGRENMGENSRGGALGRQINGDIWLLGDPLKS